MFEKNKPTISPTYRLKRIFEQVEKRKKCKRSATQKGPGHRRDRMKNLPLDIYSKFMNCLTIALTDHLDFLDFYLDAQNRLN